MKNLFLILLSISFIGCEVVQEEDNATNNIPTEIINGYILPPEPDTELNNATLQGIDSNDNGIRDDVERKIIKTYQEPIKIEFMFSAAKLDQEILGDSEGLEKELANKASRIIECKMYLRQNNIRIGRIFGFLEDNTYNTKERVQKYMRYNISLSGGVYGVKVGKKESTICDFNVTQLLKEYNESIN